jgi:serine/threonine protein kinase
MTTYASAPGIRLGGRYRLEDRIAAGSGWDAWKAIDEILARAVTVFTFAAGFPRVSDVVTAARAASRLTDPRLAQVFDVEDDEERAYIVMEWAAGETLGDLVAEGPLEPFRAARLIAEAAGALVSAHAAGVAHMCLSPGSVRWSPTGEVKVVGLGIDAALSGICADDPVVRDTQGLGRLLYVALTGHWPGPEYPSLPLAPDSGGEPCSPRQVIAGIPLALSEIACQAMQLPSAGSGQPITTPADLSRALMATLPPGLPEALEPPARRDRTGRTPDAGWAYGGNTWQEHQGSEWSGGPGFADTAWPADSEPGYDLPQRRLAPSMGLRSPGRRRAAGAPRSRRVRGVLVAVGLVAVALAVIGAALSLHPGGGPGGGSSTPTPGSSTPLTSATVLKPVGASGFDPLTSVKADPSNEESLYAKFAIDDNPRTAWTSQWYATPDFGHLKAGSGMLIDMGKAVRYSSVTITFDSRPGANVRLLTGNSSARSKQNLLSMKQLAARTNAVGTVTFTISSQVTGRYLAIWFTKLPPQPGAAGKYEARIYNVTVRGTPATG